MLTVRTAAGPLVLEVDKEVSFIVMFDEVQTAIATFTAMPVTAFDVRFSLPGQIQRGSAAAHDESGT